MKKYIIAMLAIGFASTVYAQEGTPPPTYNKASLTYKRAFHPLPAQLRVVDGDTVAITRKTGRIYYRAIGFDTPELNIACEKERGLKAKARLEELIKSGRFLIRPATAKDNYGRGLGLFLVGSKDLGNTLISEGLAHPYDGSGKRPSWEGC